MPPIQTSWLPAIVALLSGAVIGLAVAWATRRQADLTAASPRSTELPELLATRDSLLDRLEEIEDSGPMQTPPHAGRARYALEIEVAMVLRAIQAEANKQKLIEREARHPADRRR